MRLSRFILYVVIGACLAFFLLRIEKLLKERGFIRGKTDNQQIVEEKYLAEGISFARCNNGVIFGQILGMKNSSSRDRWNFLRKLADEARMRNKHILFFPDGFVEKYFTEKPGDEVMLISSAGRQKATIARYGIAYANDIETQFMLLEPSNFKLTATDNGRLYVVLRRDRFYDGKVIKLREYDLPDPYFKFAMDSIRMDAQMWANALPTSSDLQAKIDSNSISLRDRAIQMDAFGTNQYQAPERISARAFGVNSERMPDTLLVLAAREHASVLLSYTVIYRLERRGSEWKFKSSGTPNLGLPMSRIDCAFDLDDNGKLEYLLVSPTSCQIYTWLGNELKRVAASMDFDPAKFKL